MYLPPVLWAWIRAPATHFLGTRILTTSTTSTPPAAFSALPQHLPSPFSVIVLSSQYLFQRGPIWVQRLEKYRGASVRQNREAGPQIHVSRGMDEVMILNIISYDNGQFSSSFSISTDGPNRLDGTRWKHVTGLVWGMLFKPHYGQLPFTSVRFWHAGPSEAGCVQVLIALYHSMNKHHVDIITVILRNSYRNSYYIEIRKLGCK